MSKTPLSDEVRAALETLATEYDQLAEEQAELMRTARTAGRGNRSNEYRFRKGTYEQCARIARSALGGSTA